MPRRPLKNSRAIITGASSGIGRSLALALASRGARCVLLARREERLGEVLQAAGDHADRLHALVGDVCDPDARRNTLDLTLNTLGGLDLLINNAGVGAMGRFEHGQPERLRQLLDVNVVALAEMTRQAIPHLKRAKGSPRSCIVNVGSIVGLRGVPHNSEYSATKFAVTGLSESLRAELAADGIDVLLVSPGTTETEFFDRLIDKASAAKFPPHRPVTADYVAQQIVEAVARGRRHIIPYAPARILYYINRLWPGLADRILARYA